MHAKWGTIGPMPLQSSPLILFNFRVCNNWPVRNILGIPQIIDAIAIPETVIWIQSNLVETDYDKDQGNNFFNKMSQLQQYDEPQSVHHF